MLACLWTVCIVEEAEATSRSETNKQNAMNAIETITKRVTAFPSFGAMLNAQGSYRPSFYVKGKSAADQRDIIRLADAYDIAQELRGDERRAYRGDFA